MNREDAYFFKILLMSGLKDGFDEWLDRYLESETPLSDIVLSLALCGSDIGKTISCLHNYCSEQNFNEKVVCDKLRLFLKEAYHSMRFSKEEVVTYMHRFAANHGDPGDFDTDFWDDMYYMEYYQSLAKDGVLPWERFDLAFYAYLDDGIPIDSYKIWNLPKRTSKSFLEKIKKLFSEK